MVQITGNVRISGVINDVEFSASGSATGDPSAGRYKVSLKYSEIPKGWHPLMYADPKVGLLFLKEQDGGENFQSVTGGRYTSAGTIDLGDGNLLRNNADIRMLTGNRFIANYVMSGTAHIDRLIALEFFEETMLPLGPGRAVGLAIARWKTRGGKPLDGLFSNRYSFDPRRRLARPQVRRIEAKPTMRGMSFSLANVGSVRALPRLVERKGPYIGNLIG